MHRKWGQTCRKYQNFERSEGVFSRFFPLVLLRVSRELPQSAAFIPPSSSVDWEQTGSSSTSTALTSRRQLSLSHGHRSFIATENRIIYQGVSLLLPSHLQNTQFKFSLKVRCEEMRIFNTWHNSLQIFLWIERLRSPLKRSGAWSKDVNQEKKTPRNSRGSGISEKISWTSV